MAKEWVISIEEKLAQRLQENMPCSWAKLSIYRIPRYLKTGEDKAWVPQIVSLGPYHHGEEHLRHMEQHKLRCLSHILRRSNQGISLYLNSVKEFEERARACYQGTISMNDNEFVEMMVLDGCFAIEMFQGFHMGFEALGYPPDDPVFSMRGLILPIQRDMIMLENQIPFFILNQLFDVQRGSSNQEETVAKLAINFFYPLMPIDSSLSSRFDRLDGRDMVHCLEVFRKSLLNLDSQRPETRKYLQSRKRLTFCLSELREAGIQIKRRSSNALCDIQFKNGILEIPPIEIHEGTRSLFLNLIAFEQSHFNCSNDITSYVIFMHNLMNSPEDVRHLRNCRIIEHFLGSDAKVANLFCRLCQEVAFDPNSSYLLDISINLAMSRFRLFPLRFSLAPLWAFLGTFLTRKWREFLNLKWNAWKVILEHKYFNNPWSIISLLAAIFLFVFTFIQAYYTVYAYYRPRS